MKPRLDSVAEWLEFAGSDPASTIEEVIARFINAVPVPLARPKPPQPSYVRITEGDADEVLEQLNNALDYLQARGLKPARFSFDMGCAYLYGE